MIRLLIFLDGGHSDHCPSCYIAGQKGLFIFKILGYNADFECVSLQAPSVSGMKNLIRTMFSVASSRSSSVSLHFIAPSEGWESQDLGERGRHQPNKFSNEALKKLLTQNNKRAMETCER